MAADAAAMGAAFVAAYYLAGRLMTDWLGWREVLPIDRYLWVLAVSVPAGWVALASFGGYDVARLQGWLAGAGRTAPALFVHGVVLAAAVFFAKEREFARRVIGVQIALDFAAVAAARGAVMRLAAGWGRREAGLRRVLVLGGGEGARRFVDWARGEGWGLRVVGVLAESAEGADFAEATPDRPPITGLGGRLFGVPWLGPPRAVGEVLDREVVDDVVLAEPTRDFEELGQIVRKCEEVGCIVHVQSEFFPAALSRPHVESFGGMSFLTFSAAPYAAGLLAIKRAIDIVGAAALLTGLSWLMALIFVAVRLTSRGRAIFAQQRVGLNGRVFTMYKFRSMVEGAEALRGGLEARNEADGPAFKMSDDPRLTPVGRRLRRYSLDELPQLWNVLRGDISLVGPRPPLASEVSRYERWQRRRLSMRPGMTGLWQTRGRHRTGFDAWMRYDLEYIDTWSLGLDLKILLMTVPAILSGGGA